MYGTTSSSCFPKSITPSRLVIIIDTYMRRSSWIYTATYSSSASSPYSRRARTDTFSGYGVPVIQIHMAIYRWTSTFLPKTPSANVFVRSWWNKTNSNAINATSTNACLIRHCNDDTRRTMYDSTGDGISHRRIQQRRQFSNDSSNNKNKNKENILKIAIVGSGPSGCYTAKYLSKALHQQQLQSVHASSHGGDTERMGHDSVSLSLQFQYQMDIIEKLPTPYGLVRYGVAPDHPEVKNVQNDFDQLFQSVPNNDNTNNNTKPIQFLGNVTVGKDVQLDELRQLYSMVILCYGCDSDQKLHLPTVAIPTSPSSSKDQYIPHSSFQSDAFIMSAREFVAWYNGRCILVATIILFHFSVNSANSLTVGFDFSRSFGYGFLQTPNATTYMLRT